MIPALLGRSVASQLLRGSTEKALLQGAVSHLRSAHLTMSSAASQIQMKVSVDDSRLKAAMSQYLAITKKSLPEVIKKKGGFIAIDAMYNTYKADKDDIRTQLNAPSNMNPKLSVAESLVVSRNPFIRGRDLKRAARAIIAKRTRAVAFLRSGWIPALRALGARMTAKVYGKDKGYAILPKEYSLNPVLVIANTIQAGGNVKAHTYMLTALQSAIDKEARSMLDYVARKVAIPAAKRFNALGR